MEKKRFDAACAAMQGLLSQHIKHQVNSFENWEIEPVYFPKFLSSARTEHNHKELVRDAYMIADEMLKQENQ